MSNGDFLDTKIDAFWEWFTAEEYLYKAFFADESLVDKDVLVEKLNNRVLDFGLFSWQIGPGVEKKHFLTISPNGDRRRLMISKQIMHAAPNLSDWEFNYCKPAKDWDFNFNMYDEYMIPRDIDASTWTFFLSKHREKGIQLLLDVENILHLDHDTRMNAAELVIINCIGEENKIKHLNKFGLVDDYDAPNNQGKKIQELKASFESLLNLL